MRRAWLDRGPLTVPNADQVRTRARLADREANPWFGTRGMLVCLPPGRGKSLAALYHIFAAAQDRVRRGGERFGHPTLIVVPSNLLDQWEV